MYTLPQEIEAKYIIPAIRRDLSKKLVKDYKISYRQIGKILGVTRVAVCQYVLNKRAYKIKIHPKIDKEIGKSSEKIFKGKSDAVSEISRILKIIRKKKLHCELCGRIVDGKLHDCKQIVVKYSESL